MKSVQKATTVLMRTPTLVLPVLIVPSVITLVMTVLLEATAWSVHLNLSCALVVFTVQRKLKHVKHVLLAAIVQKEALHRHSVLTASTAFNKPQLVQHVLPDFIASQGLYIR